MYDYTLTGLSVTFVCLLQTLTEQVKGNCGHTEHEIYMLVSTTNILYKVCVFLADRKNKMAIWASDWLRHLRLLL